MGTESRRQPGFSWNPITGCDNHIGGICKGGGFPCYAHRLAHTRLRERYLANEDIAPEHSIGGSTMVCLGDYNDPFYPRFWPERLDQPLQHKKPAGIFVCDMGELFGDWVPGIWQDRIFDVIRECPQHRFYLLTKQPRNLPQWSPFPLNVYLGVTATNQEMLDRAIYYLKMVDAKVKFISMEPLLGKIDLSSYIGYHEPVYKEVSNVTETERRNCVSSGGTGGIGNRQDGPNLESKEPHRDSLGGRGSDNTVPQTPSRKRYGEVSSGEGNGGLEENTLPSSSPSVEALPRDNSREYDGQSQEWQQEGQQPKKSGIGDLFGEHSTYVESSSEGTCFEAEWRKQRNGETDRRSGKGDQSTIKRDIKRNGDETRSQNSGIGNQVRSELSHDLGCNSRKSLGIDLIIIGAQTGPVKQPQLSWVKEIMDTADAAGIPIFLKNNLKPVWPGPLRQEMPREPKA